MHSSKDEGLSFHDSQEMMLSDMILLVSFQSSQNLKETFLQR